MDATWSARVGWGLRRRTASGEFPSEVEVLAVGLCESVPQGLGLLAELFLGPGDRGGEGEDEIVLAVLVGLRVGGWLVLAAETFDAFTQGGVRVEEGVGDAGLALDGLEGDGFAAFGQGADGGVGCLGFLLGFAAGRVGEGVDALLAGVSVSHGWVFRGRGRAMSAGGGPGWGAGPWDA